MWKDEIVEEVRQGREEYAAQFQYDLMAIVRDIQQREKESGHDIVIRPQIGTEGKLPSARRVSGRDDRFYDMAADG